MNKKRSKKTEKTYDDIESDSDGEDMPQSSFHDLNQPKDHDFHLYTTLGIKKDATSVQIKKAYRVTSLKVHPDKNPNDSEADQKFQKVNEAYVILTDEKKKKRYDLTGEIDDDNLDDLINKCRFFYKEFTADDITDFSSRYKNSKDEQEDLINFYEEYDGDLTNLLQFIPLSSNSDIDRFVSIYEKLIREKTLESTSAFLDSRNNIQPLADEQAEFEEELKSDKKRDKKGKNKGKKKSNKPDISFAELQNRILAKKTESSGNFLSSLASKYCQEDDEPMGDMPSEEEFQKLQNSLNKPKNVKNKKKKGAKKV